MKIKSIRIENFRSFVDQEIPLNQYSCFVGANGAGKSTVLCALNVFFKEQDLSATDTQKLCDEDFFEGKTEKPIRITLTFDDLNDKAKEDLSDYVRQDELVVTAEAEYDVDTGSATVRYYGQRLGFESFRHFFETEKGGGKVADLKKIYAGLRGELDDLPAATTKAGMSDELRKYESDRADECVLIPSEDNFYGVNSTGKLAKSVQWVYVPAVKDAGDEGLEGKNTAIGKLITRVVRSKTAFDEAIESLKQKTLAEYEKLLKENTEGLNSLSDSLEKRLASWAHPNVKIEMAWLSDQSKSVQVQQPVAGIKTGDGSFLGSLARMGHGLQRSYLLALLQELAASDATDAPTLILGCEEPELYQHPPQARHLADVFAQLAEGNNQVLVTTHSPLFVSGEGFESVRLVRSVGASDASQVSSVDFDGLCERIRAAKGDDTTRKIEGLVAKIHQSLQPHIAEMFFTRVPILVEGLEDASYITTALHLAGKWNEFRRLGCHIVPVNGKDKLIQPIAIAKQLGIPVFVLFDADGDCQEKHRPKHERDNNAIIKLLGITVNPFPENNCIENDHAVWKDSITKMVAADFGEDCAKYKEAARIHYAHEGDLEKNDLFIADFLAAAYADGKTSPTLTELCETILQYATTQLET
jgi:energy-coupling factor transporter ATP-binding protein EcfA2